VAARLEKKLSEAQTRLEIVLSLQSRVDRLEQEMSLSSAAATEQSQRLAFSVEELRHTHRTQFEELDEKLSGQMASILARLTAQEERLEAVAALVSRLSASVSSAEQQIDRQTSWLRGMQERQAKRAAALGAVLEGISRLRDSEPLANAAEGGSAS
jgi:septal ring factor EnvC (AmiA/AmiB activator)